MKLVMHTYQVMSTVFSTVGRGISAIRVCLVLLCIDGCQSGKHVEMKTLSLGQFQITVPEDWEPVKENGIDSFVGRMALTDGDTVFFDLGWYSNSFEEENLPYTLDEKNVYLLDQRLVDSSQVYVFYGTIDTVDLEKFHKNRTTWSTIDGRRAKIVQPRVSGDGMTGIYIDSVWQAGSGIDRFQMNGRNLTSANQEMLLAAFQTLRFVRTPRESK